MKKFLGLRPLWAFGIFVLLDVVCIGMGMGLPIFCILFGFPVGWFVVKYITARTTSIPQVFRKVLWYATITASVTLLGMIIIWGPTVSILFEPGRDLANTGVPMILYEPMPSFIGWIVLMILISPVLQLLTTLFGSHLALLGWLNDGSKILGTIT
ncbi:MAG: hypothetical protein WAM09_08055 [Anaerolineales bacterium]|jgi:hypothetical protein